MNNKKLNKYLKKISFPQQRVKDFFDENKPIDVSIICNSFNSADYLEQCLESLLNQLVDFNVEILIHDDCSSDQSKSIIEKYKKQYPQIIKPIIQPKNTYSQGINFMLDYQYSRVNGKYIAFCEADDYWCDDKKLFLQKSLLDRFSDVSFCGHKTNIFDCSINKIIGSFPKGKNTKRSAFISNKFVLKNIYKKVIFHTSSFFIRTSSLSDYFLNAAKILGEIVNFDDLSVLLFSSFENKGVFINETYSCYRFKKNESWTDNYSKLNLIEKNKYYLNLSHYYEKINDLTKYKYDKFLKHAISYEKVMSYILIDDIKKILEDKVLAKELRRINFKKYFLYKVLKR